MPDNLKHLLNQDIDVPFIVAMVAQAKAFVIDKAMLSLIITFMGAGVICGTLLYQVKLLTENQTELIATINEMALSQNTMSINIQHMKEDISDLTNGVAKHLIGHPIRITR